jgi:hypothetical protein
VLDSTLGHDTAYLVRAIFFLLAPPGKYEDIVWIRQHRFLPSPFQIHHSSVVLPSQNLNDVSGDVFALSDYFRMLLLDHENGGLLSSETSAELADCTALLNRLV